MRTQTVWGITRPNLEKRGRSIGRKDCISPLAFACLSLFKSKLTSKLLRAAVTIPDYYETPLHHGS